VVTEGSRGQGFKGSSEMKKELQRKDNWVHHKRYCGNRKNVKSADTIFRKQTLESLTPGILGPSFPTKLEKNLIFVIS
jgi:hypothetical protein